ncbi:MAG: helix-turn-helix domain-containing protein [Proteobacteria bacterium]|nr:helix-turn-helix domain-containing protein [Pseudomonadota bacterium]
MLLRHYLERGLSKAEIARELGVARRTVYHWIATGHGSSVKLDDARRCGMPRDRRSPARSTPFAAFSRRAWPVSEAVGGAAVRGRSGRQATRVATRR